jgi:hypothetical protein
MLTWKQKRLSIAVSLLVATCLVEVGGTARAQEPSPPRLTKFGRSLERPPEYLSGPQPTAILESWWPAYPEWLAMFSEIMAGNQLSPLNGWYRKAIGQTRFDWNSLCSSFDVNGDRRISRNEIPISEADFDRLDLNHNGLLSYIDFGVIPKREHLARIGSEFSIGAFGFTDKNGNGLVEATELNAMLFANQNPIAFDVILATIKDELKYRLGQASADHQPGLTLADFQVAFDLAARHGTLPARPLGELIPGKVSPVALMTGFLKQDIGAWGAGPAINTLAPGFRLPAADGTATVSLSDMIRDKPLVLIFGSFTCGPFRNHAASIESLARRYQDRAHFLVVYTREAHPKGGWQMPENQLAKIQVDQPSTLEARTQLAQTCRHSMKLGIPMVVDTMDDRVGRLYSGMPNRMYLIDSQGKIAYKGGRGPFGFKPYELEQSLILLLQAESQGGANPSQAANPK